MLSAVHIHCTVNKAPQVRIDLDSPVPVYRQLVEQLRSYLVEGVVKPDDRLPSVRRLALELGIHFNTVAQAYRMLAEEGWLEVSHGKPVKVLARQAPTADPEAVSAFRRQLRNLVAETRALGVSPQRIGRELRALAEGVES
jgi:GntR family transcriptional regulator